MLNESLILFRDIASTRSFSQGAAMSNVSQSAASQHVAALEKALGIELLDRSTRPLGVSGAGQLFLEFCRETLKRYGELQAELKELKLGGTVRFPRERLERWLRDREQGQPRIRRQMLSSAKSAPPQESRGA